MSASENGWIGSRGWPMISVGGSNVRRSAVGGATRPKNSPWSTEADGLGSWLTQSSSIWPSSGPRRGTSDASRPQARATGAPKVSDSSSGVKPIAQPSSALSSTGISISIPCTRDGSAAHASSVVLAPSEVPPSTALSISRWSSSASVWAPNSVIE